MEQTPAVPTPSTPANPPTSEPTPPPSTPPKPKKLFKKILLALTVISLASFIAGGIGIYTLSKALLPPPSTDSTSTTTPNQKINQTTAKDAAKILNNPIVKKMIQTMPLPKVTMIPITLSPTPSDSPGSSTIYSSIPTEWETYTSTDLNFSINYPATQTKQENNQGLGVFYVTFFSSINGSPESPDYQFLIFPQAIGSLIGQDFDTLYHLPNPSSQIIQMGNTSQQFTKLQNRTINGLRAFDFQSTSNPPQHNELPQVGIYIELPDTILTISTNQTNQAILNAMLQTFKHPL